MNSRKAPIDSLPLEILINIFYQITVWPSASGPVPDSCYQTHLRRLSQVCKRWEALVNGAPVLWTHIEYRGECPDQRLLWKTALARSGSFPLTLDIHDHHTPSRNPEMWSSVMSAAHRWRSAEIRVQPGAIAWTATKPAPLLETLTIAVEPRHEWAVDLFQGSTPKLKTLRLEGLPFRNWSSILRGLRSLSLGWFGDLEPSPDQLFEAFTLCPDLEDIYLRDFQTPPTKPAPSPVSLLRLRELRLTQVSTGLADWIVRSLHTPKCRKYAFEVPPSFSPSLTSHLAQIFHGARKTESPLEIKLSVAALGVMVNCQLQEGYQISYHCSFCSGPESDNMSPHTRILAPAIVRALSSLPVQVELVFSWAEWTHASYWHLAMGSVPVQSLKFNAWFGRSMVNQSLAMLSAPREDHDGVKWILPELRKLEVGACQHGRYEPEALLNFVQERVVERKETAPLSSLIVGDDKCMVPKVFDGIRELLGDGARWDRVGEHTSDHTAV